MKFVFEKATIINTYTAMKSCIKNLDESGRSGAIRSQKAQNCLICYACFSFFVLALFF
jgi:hypothetical protein